MKPNSNAPIRRHRSKEDIEAGARKAAQRAALLLKHTALPKPQPATEVRLRWMLCTSRC